VIEKKKRMKGRIVFELKDGLFAGKEG